MRKLGGRVLEVVRPGLVHLTGGHASDAGVAADATLVNGGTPADLVVRLSGFLFTEACCAPASPDPLLASDSIRHLGTVLRGRARAPLPTEWWRRCGVNLC